MPDERYVIDVLVYYGLLWSLALGLNQEQPPDHTDGIACNVSIISPLATAQRYARVGRES